MSLFASVTPDNQVFKDALQKYFGGELDRLTLETTLKSDRRLLIPSLYLVGKTMDRWAGEICREKRKLFVIEKVDNEHEMEIVTKSLKVGRSGAVSCYLCPPCCGFVRRDWRPL